MAHYKVSLQLNPAAIFHEPIYVQVVSTKNVLGAIFKFSEEGMIDICFGTIMIERIDQDEQSGLFILIRSCSNHWDDKFHQRLIKITLAMTQCQEYFKMICI